MATSPSRSDKTRLFLELHEPGKPLLLPNPWDAGSAKILASLGYRALATTSSGFAGTHGRQDGNMSADEALAHGGTLADATELPVSADLENGFADDPEGVATTVRRASEVGLAGCSIEDYAGPARDEIYPAALAIERIEAAVRVARDDATRIVLTARAESHIHGGTDLDETIERLQAFVAAGADVVYAPGLRDLGEITKLVAAVSAPVNVLLLPGGPSVAELAGAGVARISVGGAFYYASVAGLAGAARELLEQGTHEFWAHSLTGMTDAKKAFD